MQAKESQSVEKHDAELLERLNMFWDGAVQDSIYHFDKLCKFSSIWLFHNNNRLAPQEFDWKTWIEHQGYRPNKKRKIKIK